MLVVIIEVTIPSTSWRPMKPHLFGTSYYDGWLLLATPTDALPTVELDICAALAPEQARWAHNTWHVVHNRVWLFFSLWRGCTSASCAWATNSIKRRGTERTQLWLRLYPSTRTLSPASGCACTLSPIGRHRASHRRPSIKQRVD